MKKSVKGLNLKQISREVGISYATLASRIIDRSMTLAEAIVHKVERKAPIKSPRALVYDHLGKEYKSIADMVRTWGVPRGAFNVRRSLGWPLDKILTTPIRNATSELATLAREHHMNYNVLYSRVNEMHWTIERALTTPVTSRSIPARDHLGNAYKSMSAMARAYGLIPCVLFHRLEIMSLEEALTAQKRIPNEGLATTDHLGNIYPTFQAMCDAYKSPDARVRRRLMKGWSLERALTTPQLHGGRPPKKV